VSVTSAPPQANVLAKDITARYDGAARLTPCILRLDRKGTYETTVSEPGFTPFTTRLVPQFSRFGGIVLAGNLLLGDIIGAGVDAATGATKDPKPNPLHVTLSPMGSQSYAVDGNGNRVIPRPCQNNSPDRVITGSRSSHDFAGIEFAARASSAEKNGDNF